MSQSSMYNNSLHVTFPKLQLPWDGTGFCVLHKRSSVMLRRMRRCQTAEEMLCWSELFSVRHGSIARIYLALLNTFVQLVELTLSGKSKSISIKEFIEIIARLEVRLFVVSELDLIQVSWQWSSSLLFHKTSQKKACFMELDSYRSTMTIIQ